MQTTSLQLARQIAVYSYKNKVKAINGEGGLAASVGLPPIFIINALYAGEKAELFTVVRKKGGIEKINVTDEQYESIAKIASNFGDDVEVIVRHAEELVVNFNSVEEDIVRDQLALFFGGVPPVVFEAAMECLPNEGIVTYDITDSLDKKSVYTFLTHADNLEHKWGLKQLKKK